jgi:hypothetical protein
MKLKKMFFVTALTVVAVQYANAQATINSNSLTGTATAPNQYLGSSSNHEVLFKAVGTERMRITLGGSVGVGTATPARTFHVQTAQTNGGIRVTQTSSGFSAMELYNSTTGGHNWAMVSTGNGNSEGAGHFGLYDYTSATYRYFVNGTNGNIGVGTTNPLHKFHVNNGNIFIGGTSPLGGPMILFGDNGTSPNNGQWGIEYVPSASGTPGLNFWRPWPTSNSGNYFMFLADNTGNVGINTNNPTARLTVNGNMLIGDPASVTLPAGYKLYVETGILAEKVKVAVKNTSDWSDYVFEKNYQLKKLEDVEKYVVENKHLPNIPSAEEVVKGGLDLANMDSKLLGKVEELTLYIIALNKRIAELEGKAKESGK